MATPRESLPWKLILCGITLTVVSLAIARRLPARQTTNHTSGPDRAEQAVAARAAAQRAKQAELAEWQAERRAEEQEKSRIRRQQHDAKEAAEKRRQSIARAQMLETNAGQLWFDIVGAHVDVDVRTQANLFEGIEKRQDYRVVYSGPAEFAMDIMGIRHQSVDPTWGREDIALPKYTMDGTEHHYTDADYHWYFKQRSIRPYEFRSDIMSGWELYMTYSSKGWFSDRFAFSVRRVTDKRPWYQRMFC